MTGACRTKERRERRGPGLAAVQKCQHGDMVPVLAWAVQLAPLHFTLGQDAGYKRLQGACQQCL